MTKKFEDQINMVQENYKKLIDENEKIKKENDDMKKEICNIKKDYDDLKIVVNKANERLTKLEKEMVCFQVQQISIKDFNASPLLIKLSIISNLSNDKMKPYFEKIKNLLIYFQKLHHDSSYPYIEIISNNLEQPLNEIINEDSVQILYNITEILYKNRSFDTLEFNNILNQFNSVSIEIQFPSSLFDNIYQNVMLVKKNNPQKIKIGIFITKINIVDDTFNKNENISSVKFESTVEQICGKNGSFQMCLKLRRVILPIYLKVIGISSFEYNPIKKIIIPPTVKAIQSCAFKCCKLLVSIEIPPSVTEIGEGCFSFCTSLEQIKIPPLVTEIGRCTFNSCTSLKLVEMTKSVKKICYEAFKECSSLKEIKLPSGVSIGKSVFPTITKIKYF
ncbi:hypothetical protein M9Y10_044356 [Tritrichomonas musculus]|uniref:Uncharacterized protein n=1 Tax=Tritrichomonas musculus TaxID=1915356 RepID=A0ABR2GNJ6_9EUKA